MGEATYIIRIKIYIYIEIDLESFLDYPNSYT